MHWKLRALRGGTGVGGAGRLQVTAAGMGIREGEMSTVRAEVEAELMAMPGFRAAQGG